MPQSFLFSEIYNPVIYPSNHCPAKCPYRKPVSKTNNAPKKRYFIPNKELTEEP